MGQKKKQNLNCNLNVWTYFCHRAICKVYFVQHNYTLVRIRLLFQRLKSRCQRYLHRKLNAVVSSVSDSPLISQGLKEGILQDILLSESATCILSWILLTCLYKVSTTSYILNNCSRHFKMTPCSDSEAIGSRYLVQYEHLGKIYSPIHLLVSLVLSSVENRDCPWITTWSFLDMNPAQWKFKGMQFSFEKYILTTTSLES